MQLKKCASFGYKKYKGFGFIVRELEAKNCIKKGINPIYTENSPHSRSFLSGI